MSKILEQIIFKSLFEDIEKTVIKQAPRSVVDKARSLKGYAFRIQSSRTGGTVDIATLIKAVLVNNQYGENSRTSDEKWVYVFGPDLRDAERKLFCNVLILPIDAATKLYDLVNIKPNRLGTIGEAPVYREKAMIKLTRGQKIDQRANNIVTGVNTILSNSEPVKGITTPGLIPANAIFLDGEEGVDYKTEDGVMYRANYKDDGTKYWEKIEAGLNYAPVNYAGRNKSDAKNFNQPIDNDNDKDAKVIGDENTIKIPKGGFKYGIKNDKEFAKLQQYLIDLSKTPAGKAEFKAYINDPSTGYNDIMKTELIKQFDKFIANGADGNYGDNAKYTIHCWYRYMADKSVYLKNWLTVITVDIANTLLSGLASNPEQNKIKVIAESRLSYKPKYMTIIQSKILQEQLKTSLFEDTIKIPKGGFKYGIKNNKEFAKLQQYVIDTLKTPADIAEFKAWLAGEIRGSFDNPSTANIAAGVANIMKTVVYPFIADGADGNFDENSKSMFSYYYGWNSGGKTDGELSTRLIISIDMVNEFLTGQSKVKVITADEVPNDAAKVIGDENTIKIPIGGFKYGIRDDKEFAKLQQFLIDKFATPAAIAEFKALLLNHLTDDDAASVIKDTVYPFIADGADGNFNENSKYMFTWYYAMYVKIDIKDANPVFLDVITVDIAKQFLKDQSKVKVIAESRLSYKPKYMTIIQSKILQEQLKTSLFEDTIKTVIKQAPRSVVDKATALKGYAFRIQSSRSGGTVDIATLINRVRISDQYGKDSHTNNEKWVYIFGPDLRDAERKFFCNVLILPIAAATKLYDLDNIAPELLDRIGEAPVYHEKAMIKLTRGQKIDQRANKRANNIVTDVNSILSNSEPVKDVTTPGLVLNRNAFYQGTEGVDWKREDGVDYRWNWTDDGIGYWEIQDPGKKYKPINYIGMDKSNDKTHYLVEPYEDDKGKDAKIPEKSAEVETTIVMPKAGFKYGIKNDKEFAKLQQFLIDSFDNPPTLKAEFYEWIESTYEGAPKGTSDLANVIKELDKFIANGADGNFDEPAKYMFSWVCIWTGENIVDYLDVITVDIVKHLLKDQSNLKVITSDDVTNDAAKVIGAGDEVIGDENTIKIPKGGFKYGIKNNKEFAKLQQYVIDTLKTPADIAEFKASMLSQLSDDDVASVMKTIVEPFIADGADGNFGENSKYMFSYYYGWRSGNRHINDANGILIVITVDIVKEFLTGQSKVKVITESRLSYKPKYMTII